MHSSTPVRSTLTALGLLMLAGPGGCTDGDHPLDDDSRVGEDTEALVSAGDPGGTLPPTIMAAPRRPAQVTSRYIVTLDRGVPDVAAAADALLRPHGGGRGHVYRSTIHGFSAVNLSPAAVEALRRNPAVKSVEEDRPQTAATTQLGPGWALDRMDDANGFDNSFDFFFNGAGVHIYVIDDGIRGDHTEFQGRLGTGVNVFDNVTSAYDPVTSFHGTAVASAAAGATRGIARGATIHAVKVTNDTTHPIQADGNDLLAAIEWVTNNAIHPAVLNVSWGLDHSALVEALEAAVASGIVVVKAAGNNGVEACNDDQGNGAQGVIVVGASTGTDQRWSSSNWGPCVSLFAPGASVNVASNATSTKLDDLSGTSFAAPYVAGIAAALLAQSVAPHEVDDQLSTSAWPGKLGNVNTSPNLLANSQHTFAKILGSSEIVLDYPYDSFKKTWLADTSGGNNAWTFKWEHDRSGTFQVVGTGSSLTLTFGGNASYLMRLRLTATSSGKTIVSTRTVSVKALAVDSCALPGC